MPPDSLRFTKGTTQLMISTCHQWLLLSKYGVTIYVVFMWMCSLTTGVSSMFSVRRSLI
ncbi:hypothetical protein MTR67_002063, partial [Solanum verrucosum]